MLYLLNLIGDMAFAGGLILNYWAYLSPTPWGSNDPSASMLKFTPYVEPVGYVPPNPCPSSPLSNSTVSITYNGPSNSVNYSNVAVWMGPLGSCSRDEDGAVHCTKPSRSNPQFNMTYVQDNSVYFPQVMAGNMSGERIFGLTVWHSVAFFLFCLASISWWFPMFTRRFFGAEKGDAPCAFLMCLVIMLGLAACVEFFINFGIGPNHNHSFNSVDNFYEPAQCGTTRQLKPGTLLKAENGRMYDMMWTAWCLIYCIGGPFLIGRAVWVADKYTDYVKDYESRRITRDVEKRAAQLEKEQKKFRAQVEKEKEKIRRVAMAEVKAEEEKKVDVVAEKDNSETGSAKTPDESAPPYLELTIDRA